jgi:hypothetical protein
MSAPKPPKVEAPEPEYLRNPFMQDDPNSGAAVDALRNGRSSLRIPLDTGLGIGFGGPREGAVGVSATAGPKGNARNAGRGGRHGGGKYGPTKIRVPRGAIPGPGRPNQPNHNTQMR